MTESYETRENDSFSDGMLYGNNSRDYFEGYPLKHSPNFSDISYIIASIPVIAGKVSRPPETICNIWAFHVICDVKSSLQFIIKLLLQKEVLCIMKSKWLARFFSI